MNDSDYLYIFPHIPKCAGSSFIKHIEKKFKNEEIIYLNYSDWRNNPNLEKTYEDYLQRTNDFFARFTPKEKSKIKLICGHTVPWGVHKNFKRKARYFTFTRKPIDRVLSMYNFFRFRYSKETLIGKKRDLFYHQLFIDGKIPEFNDWYNNKFGIYENVTNSMCQFLSSYGYIEGKISSNSIHKALRKFYFLGTVESFTEDSFYLYSLLGIKRLFWKQNISHKYIKKNSIKNYNKLVNDTILYNQVLEFRKKFLNNRNDFFDRVDQVRKLKYLIPYNQVRYDIKQTVIDISNFFRRKSRFYTIMFKYFRGKS